MTVGRPDRTANPFRQRVAERNRQFGGQYAPAPTDHLSDLEEQRIAMASFEVERAALADELEVSPW